MKLNLFRVAVRCLVRGRHARRSRRRSPGERGIALVVVMLVIAILSLIGLAANRNTITDTAIASNHLAATKAFYVADAGIEYGFNKLRQLLPSTPAITAPAIGGYTFDQYGVVAEGNRVQTVLTGTFAGLTAFIQNYRISSLARETATNAAGNVQLLVEDQLIPVFQFGIFYQNDLEMVPGANMTFTGGRIHTNSNLYMSADGATLSVDSKITSANDIYHTRKDRVATPGTVQIKDSGATYQTMDIDSTTPNWASLAQTKWGGTVQSKDMGAHGLNLPEPTGTIDIIGTGDGSIYQKAGLRIMNGAVTNKDGGPVELRYTNPNYKDSGGHLITDPGCGGTSFNVNPLATKSFYDEREQRTISVSEVDLAKLQGSTNAMAALNSPPTGQDPHVMYISSSTQSVRLVNGASLPTNGLTIASDSPLYVQGDYNTSNKPAALFGDAITVLSNNWSDANSTASNYTNFSLRTASNTTVNAAIMAGNKNTNGSQYSGGVENFMRFLENWTGKTLTYAGSLICLWESQKATGNWVYGSPVYNAPTRNWAYGIDMAHLPPGTPSVRDIKRLMWRQVTR